MSFLSTIGHVEQLHNGRLLVVKHRRQLGRAAPRDDVHEQPASIGDAWRLRLFKQQQGRRRNELESNVWLQRLKKAIEVAGLPELPFHIRVGPIGKAHLKVGSQVVKLWSADALRDQV